LGKRLDIISEVICLEDQQTVRKLIKNAAEGARTFHRGLKSPAEEMSATTPH
jgi:hypothetical protein